MNVNNAPPQPKQGMSGLTIALIIVGVVFVLALGTCLTAGWFIGREVKKVGEGLADGGLILVSPPEVVAALAGEKKDYVGTWKEKDGTSFIDIKADGFVTSEIADHGSTTKYTNLAIASFKGDDIELRPVISVWIRVSEKPHKVGDRWEMTAKGMRFERTATIGAGSPSSTSE